MLTHGQCNFFREHLAGLEPLGGGADFFVETLLLLVRCLALLIPAALQVQGAGQARFNDVQLLGLSKISLLCIVNLFVFEGEAKDASGKQGPGVCRRELAQTSRILGL